MTQLHKIIHCLAWHFAASDFATSIAVSSSKRNWSYLKRPFADELRRRPAAYPDRSYRVSFLNFVSCMQFPTPQRYHNGPPMAFWVAPSFWGKFLIFKGIFRRCGALRNLTGDPPPLNCYSVDFLVVYRYWYGFSHKIFVELGLKMRNYDSIYV